MERLSSCYFCGAAPDASLSEYPVVPRDVDPDPDRGPTVVLCPTCKRKLGTVVEAVLDAADAGASADAAETGTDPDASADPAGSGPGRDANPDPAEDVEAHLDEAPDLLNGIDDDPAALAGDDAGDPLGRSGGSENGRTGDDEATPDRREGGDDPSRADSSADADEGGGTADDGDDPLSTPAANKVVKLLQNREFPVDRGEIETVASSAYDLPARDCAAVLDALIDRGYVAERGGQLVRPD
ncbi:hypothetical protein BRC83_04665 [Halobacteriales archaeon QS_1_68_17]|nr:MAG: hypothetical protein BRC83_04665 [Halobacteriales archaeon QS_1_68_17]